MVGREGREHNSLLNMELALGCGCALKTNECIFFGRKERQEYLFEDKCRSFVRQLTDGAGEAVGASAAADHAPLLARACGRNAGPCPATAAAG